MTGPTRPPHDPRKAGEPDHPAVPDAEAAAMFTPEAAALLSERLGLDAQEFAQFARGLAAVFAAAEAAEAECRARLAASGERPS
jgi:hypothetical protein